MTVIRRRRRVIGGTVKAPEEWKRKPGQARSRRDLQKQAQNARAELNRRRGRRDAQ